jgi:hypothetical protein
LRVLCVPDAHRGAVFTTQQQHRREKEMADKEPKNKKKTDEEIEAEAKAQMADSPAGAADDPFAVEALVPGVSTSPDKAAMDAADLRAPTPLEAAAQRGNMGAEADFAPEMVPTMPAPAMDMDMADMDMADVADVPSTGATGPNAGSTTTKPAGNP